MCLASIILNLFAQVTCTGVIRETLFQACGTKIREVPPRFRSVATLTSSVYRGTLHH